MPKNTENMEATQPKKKDNTALYIVYAAAAYFGVQFLLKPKRAAAATIVTNPVTPDPATNTAYVPEPLPPATVPAGTSVTWKAESFPLRKGMKGAKIKAMQQKLGINADGAFGNDTETALLQQYGISTISQAQYQTIVGGQKTKAATPAATGSGIWIAESFPLRKGMKGTSVKALQQKLGVSPDGAFGANTETALVKKFGVATVSQTLFRSITQPVTSTFTNLLETILPLPATGKDTSPILKSGSKGQDVYRLQKWLGFKDKKAAKKGELIADSIFGKQTLTALQKKTGQTFISVGHMNTLMKQMAGMGYAGEVLVTKRPATILDSNLLPHRSVPENTILGTRLMELTDPQEQKAYTQFKTVDGFHRWVDKDAV
jgi:peptidoglycan hydrolase-like protein with peptidoglycan-binding domain